MLKIGLIGIDHPTYYATFYNVYNTSLEKVEELGRSEGFEIKYAHYILPEDDLNGIVEEINSQDLDMILLQNSGFSSGDIAAAFEKVQCKICFWGVEEPTSSGDVKLHSMVSLNLFSSISKRNYKNKKDITWVYGNADNAVFVDRFAEILAVLRADKILATTRIGFVGEIAQTFYNLAFDSGVIKEKISACVHQISTDVIRERFENVSQEEYQACKALFEKTTSAVCCKQEAVETTCKIACALAGLAKENNYSTLAMSCWPFFQEEFNIVPCVAFTLASKLADVAVSCEGDVGGAISMLIAAKLSNTMPTLMDFTQLSSDLQSVLLWHCGIASLDFLPKKEDVKVINHPMMYRKDSEDMRMGCSYDAVFEDQPITILRFTEDFTKLFYAEGVSNKAVAKGFDGTRCYIGSLKQDGEKYSAMDVLGTVLESGVEHHLVICKGHIERRLKEFAKTHAIEVIKIIKY